MYTVRPPLLFRWLQGEYLVCSLPADRKEIFLTFDDGPVPEVTPDVLGILKEKNAKATFFCVGENVRKHPGVFLRIRDEGHAIGNHTYNHLNGWKTPPGEYAGNVMRCEELFHTMLFRPPYGRFTPSQFFLLRKKFRFILWSVLSMDFLKGTSPEKCLRIVLDNTSAGSIVVFHDSLKAKENLFSVLPGFLDHFQKKGFSFRTIPGG
jgi:peptidoglycan/xylan/chitin deacetylase (PgdA/CDA1 family)